MKLSNIIHRTYNPLHNAFQYFIGSLLYFLTFNTFDVIKFFFGLIGFVVAYQSVYMYNDLMDYKEDRKDKIRRNKPLVKGEFSREYVESFSYLLLILGLSICFFVNVYFGLLVFICLFLNFLHSSPFIRLKKTIFLLPNLFVIEFLKYSSGWFIFSLSLLKFPYVLITLLSIIYLTCYIYWKQNVTNFLKNKKIITLFSISLLLYLISIFIYPFKIVLLVPIPILILFAIFKNINNSFLKVKIYYGLFYIIMISIIVSTLLLSVPSVAELNNKINKEVNFVKENITQIIPENIKCQVENIKNELDSRIENLNIRVIKI